MTDDWFDYYDNYSPTHWNYWFDTHPKTETQYNRQRFLAGIFPWYGEWMRGSSEDERNRHNRDAYGIGWSDIQYPWLSGVTSGNRYQTAGSASWQFSKNAHRLYR